MFDKVFDLQCLYETQSLFNKVKHGVKMGKCLVTKQCLISPLGRALGMRSKLG